MKTNGSIDKVVDAFKRRDLKLDYFSKIISLNSVSGCPHSCAMCILGNSKTTPVSKDVLSKIEPYFDDLEILVIQGNGEPLLGDLEYFVKKSIKHDFVLDVTTSGVLLSEEKADLLLDSRLCIRFSLNAARKETYRKIMGYDLTKTRKNIAYVIEQSVKRNLDNDFWLSYIVMEENIDEIPDFLQLASDHGIQRVRFLRLWPNRESFRGNNLPARDFVFKYSEQLNKGVRKRFFDRLPQYNELAAKLGVEIQPLGPMQSNGEQMNLLFEFFNRATNRYLGANFFPMRKRKGICVFPWFGCLPVKMNGLMRMCCMTEHDLGNVKETDPGELWNSDRMVEVRETFRKGYYPRVCGYCKGRGLDEYPANSALSYDNVGKKFIEERKAFPEQPREIETAS